MSDASDFEEEELMKWFEEGRRKKREFNAQVLPAQFKIILEGFQSELTEIQIAEGVRIFKASLLEREAFYKKAEESNASLMHAEKNEFFLTFDFELERSAFISPRPGQHLSLISIFFAACSKAFLMINKGQLYEKNGSDLHSRGLFKTQLRPFEYDSNVVFGPNDIEQLQKFWPLFNKAFHDQKHFALIARRLFYSMNRYSWSDRLIDLMILAEALVLPEECRNKGARIAKRIARLLAHHPERGTINKTIRYAYEIRNQVVHGEIVDEELTDPATITTRVSGYLKLAVQEYLLKYSKSSPVELVAILDAQKG